jgi:predicted DNA-binding transcriptional regulator AlpA
VTGAEQPAEQPAKEPERPANPTSHPEPERPVPPPTPHRKNVSQVPAALIDTEATAARLGVQVQTLKNWRAAGEGPPYVKVGRAVRYDPRALDRWIVKQTVGAA